MERPAMKQAGERKEDSEESLFVELLRGQSQTGICPLKEAQRALVGGREVDRHRVFSSTKGAFSRGSGNGTLRISSEMTLGLRRCPRSLGAVGLRFVDNSFLIGGFLFRGEMQILLRCSVCTYCLAAIFRLMICSCAVEIATARVGTTL
ncbi:hypothetical protein TSAR_008757 [Trichomalopsis sarcophagae]|uniref:Uncharacterized protein n=1 Tax=Trichomalopsis sarcophagae TaxID=543379 RepID=A0A232FJN6_9HYME|nr:hypothetical protein TSAR_008757 [Trichomalopsis sarcophagae]